MIELPVIIIGAGGHAKVIIETLRLMSAQILGAASLEETSLNIAILGDDSVILNYNPDNINLVNGIGSVGVSDKRKNIFNYYKTLGYKFVNVIHPSAVISSDVEMAEGVQVMAGAIIQSGTKIGNNTIINTKASVDHDCEISAHVHLAPGVTISGGVIIGENTHLSPSSTVIQSINIGRNAMIGAGAVVIKDVLDGQKMFGVPARPIGE